MIRILPSCAAVLGAYALLPSPAPMETVVRDPGPPSETAAESAAADQTVAAQGRRTLSTAFVRVGPDGHLTVELRDGRVLVLREVVMRRADYCGVSVQGIKPGGRHCGGYAEIVAARPGGGPTPGAPEPRLPDPDGYRLPPR